MPGPIQFIDTTRPDAVVEPLERLLAGAPGVVFPRPGGEEVSIRELPHNAAIIIQTSGSTAKPKRVWSSREALIASVDQVNRELSAPGHWWSVLPTHYIAGVMVVLRALRSESTLHFSILGQRIAEALLQFDQQVRVSPSEAPRYTSLVPKQLAELLDDAEHNLEVAEALGRFDRILVGGQRTPPELIRRSEERGLPVVRTYGSAETNGGCVWEGVPLSDTSVRIVEGRVAIAGPMLAGGYLDSPDLTKSHFRDFDGRTWFVGDDLGELSEGVLRVTGRADRVIISGGIKVNLDELQSLVHTALGPRVIVSSRSDATWGEVPVLLSEEQRDVGSVNDLIPDEWGPAWKISEVVVCDLPELPSGKWDFVSASKLANGRQGIEP